MVEWRRILIGAVFIVAIYFILAFASQGGENALFGFLLGGIAVGFIIDTKLKGLLIHGIILGVVAGLVTVIILLIQIVSYGLVSQIGTGIIFSILILLTYDVVAALAGVVLGNSIRVEYIKSTH